MFTMPHSRKSWALFIISLAFDSQSTTATQATCWPNALSICIDEASWAFAELLLHTCGWCQPAEAGTVPSEAMFPWESTHLTVSIAWVSLHRQRPEGCCYKYMWSGLTERWKLSWGGKVALMLLSSVHLFWERHQEWKVSEGDATVPSSRGTRTFLFSRSQHKKFPVLPAWRHSLSVHWPLMRWDTEGP